MKTTLGKVLFVLLNGALAFLGFYASGNWADLGEGGHTPEPTQGNYGNLQVGFQEWKGERIVMATALQSQRGDTVLGFICSPETGELMGILSHPTQAMPVRVFAIVPYEGQTDEYYNMMDAVTSTIPPQSLEFILRAGDKAKEVRFSLFSNTGAHLLETRILTAGIQWATEALDCRPPDV